MITIRSNPLTLLDFYTILYEDQKIDISKESLDKVQNSYLFLKSFSKNKVIYGVNTGFGPMAQIKIKEVDQTALQYNLIRSHCSGLGTQLPIVYIKSIMVSRLKSLSLGFSGIHSDTIILLAEFINKNIFPPIYEHGSVGASGDLVQLAHLALGLIAEGNLYFNEKLSLAKDVFKLNNLKPLMIQSREGLAIMNGTSAMCGIGIINIIHAYKLISWSVIASVLINEIVESFDDHFSSELNNVKLHIGQKTIAETMCKLSSDSKLIRKRETYFYAKEIEDGVLENKVQEYYSIRCVPQILGPVLDTIKNSEQIVLNEVNSVNDNPIIDAQNENVYHGGNFHGDYIGLEMDKMKIAITKLSMLSERQLNFLLNDKLNNILPPFINLGVLGLNFGMQGLQFTATSTVAENQTLSNPMYVHSIPNNNDNQDLVSMGTNAALLTKKVIANTFEVMAIELIAILQAVDYLQFENKLSSHSRTIFYQLRKIVPKFENDVPKFEEINNLKEYLINTKMDVLVKD